MTKYNQYAKRLDAAFKEAREKFTKAYNQYNDAQERYAEAQRWHSGENPVEKEAKVFRAKADMMEAEKGLRDTRNSVWAAYDTQVQAIRRDLEQDVRTSYAASPDAIDTNTIELLKSGVMGADDYYSLVDKFDNNQTMLRLIAKYAKEAAAEANKDSQTRMALNVLCSEIGDGKNKTMRAFDDLCQMSKYCSGRAGGRYSDNHAINMAEKWEQLSGAAVGGF